MNVLLEPPRTVVCVAADQSVANELARRLSECDFDDVISCETVEASERIESTNCGCVVLHDGVGHDEVVDRCRNVRSTDPDLPLIVVIEDDTDSIATAATVAGASATLQTPDDDQLQTVVADELSAYVRHRTAAEESEILDAMLDGLETPLYAKDTAGRHLKLADIRDGLDPSDAIGKTDIELYGDESSQFAREAYEDDLTVLESGTAVFNRDESHGASGTQHWSRTTEVPWYDDEEQLKGLVGISHDITELKQQEARLEEVRDRFREFADHLSHDLQNPLQVASGYLEMAKESGDPAAFERVETALDRMEEMIDDMSAIASHRGTEADNATTFRLTGLVDGVWSILSTGEAQLVNDLPEDYLAHAEQSELRPLLENLLQNAVDHGATGDRRWVEDPAEAGSESTTDSIAVTVRVGLTDDGGFYVEDDGPGLPEQVRNRLRQDDANGATDEVGTGLEIVESIASRNDWSITVSESELDDGEATPDEGGETASGTRFEIRNCLGAPDRTPPLSRQSLSLSETATVGDPRESGLVEYDEDADEWTVAGDGEDIWGQYNDFKFAYARVDGAARIEGRVVDVDHVGEYTKAGLMIRDDLSEDATYGYAGTTPIRGTELLWRTVRGEDGTSQQLAAEPFTVDWYRIDRIGDRVTAYLSTDGNTWDPVDERRIDVSDPVYLGLAVSSVVPGVVAEATFDNVSVSTL